MLFPQTFKSWRQARSPWMVMIRHIHKSAWLLFTADQSLWRSALCLQTVLISLPWKQELNTICEVVGFCILSQSWYSLLLQIFTNDGLHVSMSSISYRDSIVSFSRELRRALWYRHCCLSATQPRFASVVSHLWLCFNFAALNSNISLMIAFSRELGIITKIYWPFLSVQIGPLHFSTVLMSCGEGSRTSDTDFMHGYDMELA